MQPVLDAHHVPSQNHAVSVNHNTTYETVVQQSILSLAV